MKDRNLINLDGRPGHILVSAAVALFTGAAYYCYFRLLPETTIHDPSAGSFPSLIHMVTLTLLAFALTGTDRGIRLAIGLLVVSLLAEWKIGYTDINDIFMLLTGFIVTAVISHNYLQHTHKDRFPMKTGHASAALLVCSSIFITGTSPYGYNDTSYTYYDPVYMDYQTLRSAITVSEPRPLTDVSRVYIYENTIFLNSKNNGIHVVDNSDPTNPSNVAFIEIPGNTELSIRNNYLYVDSYVDLVTLNISNPRQAIEVNRQEDIFPYDPYQNLPDNIFFNGPLDEDRGVVVSYE